MRLIVGSVAMMAFGLATLFLMVIGVLAADLFLSLAAYACAFSGMLIGTFAAAQRVRR
jgi:sulfite exporter TauE/SafE